MMGVVSTEMAFLQQERNNFKCSKENWEFLFKRAEVSGWKITNRDSVRAKGNF